MNYEERLLDYIQPVSGGGGSPPDPDPDPDPSSNGPEFQTVENEGSFGSSGLNLSALAVPGAHLSQTEAVTNDTMSEMVLIDL